MAADSPQRVLMTADTVGGVWTYALELARGLTARGVELGLATMGAPLNRAQRRDAYSIDGLRLFESAYRLEWMDTPWHDVHRAGKWLLAIERKYGPALVHLNSYCHGSAGFHAPVLVAGHSCVLSWWRSVRGCDAPREWNRYRRAVAKGLAAASLVVAPTRAMLDALDLHYGPLARKAVAPNGRERPLNGSVRKQAFVFTCGRVWDEAKNLRLLEAAAPDLPWPVYVAGENRHPDGGARDCDGCRYLGRLTVRQTAWWMDRASIYALPAKYEPFGLSALEAALAGCALVLGDIQSLRETWGGAALFVEPDDAAGLRAAIQALIDSPDFRIDMAGRAFRRALDFSRERMVESYLAAYRSVIEASAGVA